jgi:hypothetical protein
MLTQLPTQRKPLRSATPDSPLFMWIALLLFGLPVGLFLIGKWCWIQGRITVNCWRLGRTRAEISERLRCHIEARAPD